MIYSATWIKSRVIITDNGCWEWQRARDRLGYGRVSKISSGHTLAHRLSYSIFCGDPEGYSVCHKCDNPPCVNPEHLFKASQEINVRDAITKGRKPPSRIVTTPEVLQKISDMLARGDKQRCIARELNISEGHITYIKQNMLKEI